MTLVHESCGCTVDPDHATATLARDHVCLEASAVVAIDDRHLLAGQQVRCVHEVGVYRDRADVVEVGLGDSRAMDLALEHRPEHD